MIQKGKKKQAKKPITSGKNLLQKKMKKSKMASLWGKIKKNIKLFVPPNKTK